MAHLVLRWIDPDDDRAGHAVVETTPCVLGRTLDCDVVLPFRFVSSRHARVERDEAGWWIEDLDSTNGVTIDGRAVRRGRIEGGCEIGLGRLRLAIDVVTLEDATVAFDRWRASSADGAVAGDLEKLRLLLELQQSDGPSNDATFAAVLRAVLTVSGAERACILLNEEAGAHFAAGRHAEHGPIHEDEFRGSRTVYERVLASGDALLSIEGSDGEDLQSASIDELHLRAVAGLPLRDAQSGSIRGVLYLDSTRSGHRLSGLDEQILRRLAIEAEAILTRLDLRRVAEQRRRHEEEMAFARRTQQMLLPRKLPAFDGFELDATCVPAREVGGDFYDVVSLDDHRLLLVVADVSGKGVAASLLAASTQAAIQISLRAHSDQGLGLAHVNDFVLDHSEEGRFVSAFVAVLHVDGVLSWSSAGHNPAYLWHAESGEIEELGLHGVVFGALESAFFGGRIVVATTRLDPGDVLLVYSDGVSEAENPARAQFGEQRLASALRLAAPGGAHAVTAAVLDTVAEFVHDAEPSDDLTLLVVCRRT